MALYRETGTNPFSSCLPIIMQMPIFLALFRLLDHAAKQDTGPGRADHDRRQPLENAKIFGAPDLRLVHQRRRLDQRADPGARSWWSP